MNKICLPNQHRTTAVTSTDTNVVLTVTNSTNISNLQDFDLIICNNISQVVTGSPLPVQVNVNGTAVSLLNRYSLPIKSNRLQTRKPYCGAYIVPETGSPYVILFNTPCCPQYAV